MPYILNMEGSSTDAPIPAESSDVEIINSDGTTIPEKSTPVGPALGFSVPRLQGFTPQDLGIDKIKYYYEHPDETPPTTIKNMVNLLKMMKEDEENPRNPDEESSDLFESSSESSEEEDVVVSAKTPCEVKSHKNGLIIDNILLQGDYLADLSFAYIHEGKLTLYFSSKDSSNTIPISECSSREILHAIDQWTEKNRK